MNGFEEKGALAAPGLRAFVVESNRIEGINELRPWDIEAHEELLSLKMLAVGYIESFVRSVAQAELRQKPGMDVRVGNHRPWPGGQHIYSGLGSLLDLINKELLSPYEAHVRYENLHPFMDGNGRSGRVIWAWQMFQRGLDPFSLPFLHRFYYQSLDAARIPAEPEGRSSKQKATP